MITPERFKEIRSLFADILDKISEDELNAISDLLECLSDVIKIANTRPAPARCDELKTEKWEAFIVGDWLQISGEHAAWKHSKVRELVTRQNAEEVIAAERMKLEATARVGLQLSEQIEALEADNASLIHDLNRIKDHETSLVNDNEAKDARIAELEADNKRLREALSIFLGDATMEGLLWGDAKSTDLVTIRVQKQKYDFARAVLEEVKL